MSETTNNVLLKADNKFIFECPGCGCHHFFQTEGAPAWQFDGDMISPTVSPSIRVNYGEGRLCHFFMKKGVIEFLSDCYHDLKSKTVQMKPVGSEYDFKKTW